MSRLGCVLRLWALAAGSVAGFLLAGPPLALRAQMQDGFWNSSAEPPAGMPAALLSPPDTGQLPPADSSQLTPGPAVKRVTGSALVPRTGDVTRGINSSGGCGYVEAGSANAVWNTVADLPNGVTVTSLRMYYRDTSASNSTVWLTAYDLAGNIEIEWNVASSGAAGNGFNDSGPVNHIINNSLYTYLLNWRPNTVGSTQQLCGLSVFYTAPLELPGAPQSLTATVGGRTVSLSWLPPASGGAPASYVVEAGSAPGLANLATLPVVGTTFVTTGVPPGLYYVRVRGVNATGPGTPSADVTLVVH